MNSGSAISILPENGTDDGSTYDPYTTYTLITADDGVFGTFGAVSDAFAFLDVNLSYDANNVYLALLRNNMDFTSIAETQNQIAVAGVVETQGTAGALYRAVLPLTEHDARDAFDQLSGEVYASTQSMLLDDSRFVREAILSHTHVTPTARSNNREAVAGQNEKYAVWGAPFGAWGDWDGDGNAVSLDRSIGGVVAGCDVMLGSSWTTGFAFGYSKTDFDVDSRLSSGSADGYHLGTYALKQLGGLDLTAGAAYSWHQVDTDRTVQFSGFRDDLEADYDADASQFFGEASYNFTTQTGRISPFLNLAYVNLNTDSFTEQGGEASLQVASSSQDMVYSTFGFRAEKQVAIGGMLLKPNGSLGWRHGFGDNVPTGDVAFESGNAFAVEGVSIARNAIVGEFGIAHDLTENASINVAYNGQFSSDLNDQGVKATFVVKF
ncbi:autotransporter domain-containing protein [Desulfobulbus sp.]|uniref:autotransporter outer membrane beta-barrel domain-containing protein n=1 Tax=Desulfobulbus sp. TaxID=895 RepID=UPI0027B9A5BA|nr:autotransporter domain-containing protein [Desulfobulbus sp.]